MIRSLNSLSSVGRLFFLCLWFILFGFFLFAPSLFAQAQPTPPPYDPANPSLPTQMPMAGLGEPIYAESCAPCHGEKGDSDGPVVAQLPSPPPKFSDPATTWDKSPAEFFHITKFGRLDKLMPPWGNRLSDDEIWQVVYYAWGLHTNQQTVQVGADRYAATCAACHGESGKGDGPQATTPLPNLTDLISMTTRSDAQLDDAWRKAHADQGADWSPEDRRAVLDAIRTFSYAPAWQSIYQPGNGLLTGLLRQGTATGAPIDTTSTVQTVTLAAFTNDAFLTTFTTTIGAGGQFSFTQLSTLPIIGYVAQSEYQGILYSSEPVALSPLTPTLSIDLPVYETTDDGSGLHLNRTNLVIDFEPGRVQIGEILGFSNLLDRTYVGRSVAGLDQPATLSLTVPALAEDFQFQDGVYGGRYKQVENTVYDTAPVLPGDRFLFMSYRVPVESRQRALLFKYHYPVGQVNLLVADLPGLQIEAAGLQKTDAQTIEGRNYTLWSGMMPEAGLPIKLTGILTADMIDPRASAESANATGTESEQAAIPTEPALDPKVAWILAGLVTLALAAALILPLRQQARATARGKTTAANTALQTERDELIRRIAELDDRHATGKLADAEWAQTRAQWKSRLMEIYKSLQ